MGWFNYIGLIFIILIMIPNIIYLFCHQDDFKQKYKNRIVEALEQVGRYGSFFFMIFNIPYTYFSFWFLNGLIVYIIVGASLIFVYLLSWVLFWSRHQIIRAYLLSIIPSALFIFSGIMLLSIPLLIFSLIFAFSHITISLKNAYQSRK